jgi:hypothetical protein
VPGFGLGKKISDPGFNYVKPLDALLKITNGRFWWRKADPLAQIVLQLSCSQLTSLSVILAA